MVCEDFEVGLGAHQVKAGVVAGKADGEALQFGGCVPGLGGNEGAGAAGDEPVVAVVLPLKEDVAESVQPAGVGVELCGQLLVKGLDNEVGGQRLLEFLESRLVGGEPLEGDVLLGEGPEGGREVGQVRQEGAELVGEAQEGPQLG